MIMRSAVGGCQEGVIGVEHALVERLGVLQRVQAAAVVGSVGGLEVESLGLVGRDGDGQVVREEAPPPEHMQQRGHEECAHCGRGDERERHGQSARYPRRRHVTILDGRDGGCRHGKCVRPPRYRESAGQIQGSRIRTMSNHVV